MYRARVTRTDPLMVEVWDLVPGTSLDAQALVGIPLAVGQTVLVADLSGGVSPDLVVIGRLP